jgi:hypothetical protein
MKFVVQASRLHISQPSVDALRCTAETAAPQRVSGGAAAAKRKTDFGG